MEKKKKNAPNKGETLFYTIKEAAEIFRVSKRTVERLIRDRRVSSCKPLHKRLIPQSEVHGLINESWTPAMPPE